jgi:hypothetical protein
MSWKTTVHLLGYIDDLEEIDCSEIVRNAFLCPKWIIMRIWCELEEWR